MELERAMAGFHSLSLPLCAAIVEVLRPHIPPNFRGEIRLVLDNGELLPENVTVSVRPPQGSAKRLGLVGKAR